MRSARGTDNIPYCMKTVYYFEVGEDGGVSRVHHKNKSDRPGVLAAYQRAMNKTTILYDVWQGKWSSDLFIIDDLNIFAKEFGLV